MKFEAEARLRKPDEVNGDVVYDGDTFKLVIRPWIGQQNYATIRLLGIDTAELHGERHSLAVEQKVFVEAWMDRADDKGEFPLIVEAIGEDSFGRILADVKLNDTGEYLSDAVLEEYGEEFTYE